MSSMYVFTRKWKRTSNSCISSFKIWDTWVRCTFSLESGQGSPICHVLLTVQNTHRRALLFIENSQFIGFLHKQNWAVSTDVNFIVTYWTLIKHQALLTILANFELAVIIFFYCSVEIDLWNPRKRVVRGGKLWSPETLLCPDISN